MKANQINQKIAEYRGYREIEFVLCDDSDTERLVGYAPNVTTHKSPIPDYFNDLNAVQKVVRDLIFSKRHEYRKCLQMVMSQGLDEDCLVSMSECVDATSQQRCMALLMMIAYKEVFGGMHCVDLS